ncbi:MAG: 23S rRNA (adenine(2503)-C(2))-methyltransferase RlmN [Parcubacteria group bacterium]|jgi:23S rRNA (adenine(2503)-C(2))-methyltransferase
MDLNELEKILKENNQPKFRLEQIKKAIFEDGAYSFLEISTISKDLRELLNKKLNVLSFKVEKVLESKDGKSVKALFKIHCHSERLAKNPSIGNKSFHYNRSGSFAEAAQDDNVYYIETVLLSPRPNTWTACISSQVGCSLRCEFCATGKGGFKRNLTAEEITDQILFWKQYLKKNKINGNFSNIVYMGMGEPFLNWEEVKKSVEDLINPKLFNFGSRSISISTVGIKGGIEKYLAEFPQVNLAISLHFADNEMRSQYMPVNKSYDLEDIKKDLQEYFKKSKRKVFIEYIMFEGLNDEIKDADKLMEYLKSIGNSYLLHVNLISYNETFGEFKSSSKNKIEKFKDYLLQNKINATIRKSLGTEIAGACGQLAGK